MDKEALLNIENLKVEYRVDGNIIHTVNDVDLQVRKGETLALVGETGAGKTTIAKAIMQICPTPPTKIVGGKIFFKEQDVLVIPESEKRKIRGNQISMIFQDPMTALNPVETIGKQIAECFIIHDSISRAEANNRAIHILEQVGIPGARINEYPHQFSGGMKQRVVIAMALACSPELLIADEPTTALDVTIQVQVLALISELKEKLGTSVLLITHDLGIVAGMCDSVAVIYAGEILEYGSALEIFDFTTHPYTKGLFDSLPSLNKNSKRLKPIPGLMPDPSNLPKGCKFSPRCPYATEECRINNPRLRELRPGHFTRCHHPVEAKNVDTSRG